MSNVEVSYPFFNKGVQTLLWAPLRATHIKITVSGIAKLLRYCVIFIAYKTFTNVAADCIIQPGGLQIAICSRKVCDTSDFGY